MSNRYKTSRQSLPIAAWIIGCCVAACIVGFGIKFLMVKYTVFKGGKDIKELEVRLSRLNTSNEALQVDIARYAAPTALAKKHGEGFIKLRKIAEDKDVIFGNRNDKRVAWKDGVAYVASNETTSVKKPSADAGGTR